jgi:hypothetical protein
LAAAEAAAGAAAWDAAFAAARAAAWDAARAAAEAAFAGEFKLLCRLEGDYGLFVERGLAADWPKADDASLTRVRNIELFDDEEMGEEDWD